MSIVLTNLFMKKKIKKALRLIALAFMISLAGIGIGLSGGVPIGLVRFRIESEEDKIEMIDIQKDDTDSNKAYL